MPAPRIASPTPHQRARETLSFFTPHLLLEGARYTRAPRYASAHSLPSCKLPGAAENCADARSSGWGPTEAPRDGFLCGLFCSSSFLDLGGYSIVDTPIPSHRPCFSLPRFTGVPLGWGRSCQWPPLCSPVPSPPYPPVCATQTLMRGAEAVSIPQLGCPVRLPSSTLSTGGPNRLSFRRSAVAPLNSEATHTPLAFLLPVFSLPLTPFFPPNRRAALIARPRRASPASSLIPVWGCVSAARQVRREPVLPGGHERSGV